MQRSELRVLGWAHKVFPTCHLERRHAKVSQSRARDSQTIQKQGSFQDESLPKVPITGFATSQSIESILCGAGPLERWLGFLEVCWLQENHKCSLSHHLYSAQRLTRSLESKISNETSLCSSSEFQQFHLYRFRLLQFWGPWPHQQIVAKQETQSLVKVFKEKFRSQNVNGGWRGETHSDKDWEAEDLH